MDFEYDFVKSDSNLKKHGIDFEESKNLWLDDNRLQIQAKSETEPRLALIALYKEKLWTAFFTERNDKVRIISVRRSRIGERSLYDES